MEFLISTGMEASIVRNLIETDIRASSGHSWNLKELKVLLSSGEGPGQVKVGWRSGECQRYV